MNDKRLSWQKEFEQQETFFRLISPEDYLQFGINPQDVPMGTFAAEDHPSFLPSRFGGNAYGLGLIEQSVLSRADTDFLESLDFQNIQEIGNNARRLNAIYQKLGLLIRFSLTGKRYFLIPINLVAHSLQEIKTKADEIEELIIQHIFETRTERLDIGLLTASHDLIVHELTARLSSHRIFIFESIEKLRAWRMPLDIVILPKDPFEYLLEQRLPRSPRTPMSRQRLQLYAMYLTGRIYDILEPNGKIHVLAHSTGPKEDQLCHVQFRSEEDLKFFLLFSHTFKTKKRYQVQTPDQDVEVHLSDLHYYLNRFALFEPHLKRLLDHHKPEELTLDEINRLPYLNLRQPQTHMRQADKQWRAIFEPYFMTSTLKHKSPRLHHSYWEERLDLDCEMPESLFVYVGSPRQPDVSLATLEEEIKASGMLGCTLPLVAEYRNTFRYVTDVLKIIIRIRNHDFPNLTELERTRLSNPFRGQNESFNAVVKLLAQIPKLEKIREMLNPDDIEGHMTPVLESIPKLSLHGFPPAQLREILLIVVGHTTMSRVVFGKIPAKTLKPITDKGRAENHQESLDLLRVCRLMSFAEIVAALGDTFTPDQARELYRVYDDAINVATDPRLDWDRLQDLRISALGGVENMAVREMMKFFNLFEFLDVWQEFMRKGAAQREVICDYQPERLRRLEEAIKLARIARQFKEQFMGDYIFGQSYFFRQFLDTEFHGTGHLFPKLGTRAGFILLWIAVNAAERHIINFNPILAGIAQDRLEPRLCKLKETLLRIPPERLEPDFFDEIKRTLASGRPAFVFDSGIRIMTNPETRAVDISFVDVDENIQQIEALLTHFESRKLRDISLKNLQELERRFSELQSFHHYLHQEGCYLQCGILDLSGGLELKDREIGEIEQRLKRILQGQIFIPEEIYDTISVLAKECPSVLRFILPEFAAMGNLIENWPTRHKQSLGVYVMRCLEKFQALVIKDRNAFQDRNAFYQLAKQEFGPLAEEGTGPTHAQMDILEYLVDRIQERPQLYQALTLALVFQEIGKIEQCASDLLEAAPRLTHAEQGAIVLERSEILRRYRLDPQIEQLVIQLVRHHGLIGHVIQGEEPIPVLGRITEDQNERLVDVFLLHSVLAASAVQEGLMVSDLLDLFLHYRSTALQVMRSKSDWEAWLRDFFREKGRAVQSELESAPHDIRALPSEQMHYCGFVDRDIEDEPLWHGRQTAALERLLKLTGANWVDYQDLQMLLFKMPVNFIYHKKKLKSVGLVTFERQLRLAMRVLEIVASLSAEVRYYLLYCLDHLGGGMRIYDFHPLPRFLGVEEAIKLLLVTLQAFHHHFGTQARHGLVSFRKLSQNIERRHEILQNMLGSLPFPMQCFEGGRCLFAPELYGELHFHPNPNEQAVRANYHDTIQFDHMVQSIESIWSHEQLALKYENLLQELQQRMPYDTKAFEEELLRVFEEQQRKINELILRNFQERLNDATSFAALHEIQKELQAKEAEVNFPEEQQFLLKEMFEFHRSRLRDLYLDGIYREINAIDSREVLSNYWNRIKHELFAYRPYVGKEYESLIAQFVDHKLEHLD